MRPHVEWNPPYKVAYTPSLDTAVRAGDIMVDKCRWGKT